MWKQIFEKNLGLFSGESCDDHCDSFWTVFLFSPVAGAVG